MEIQIFKKEYNIPILCLLYSNFIAIHDKIAREPMNYWRKFIFEFPFLPYVASKYYLQHKRRTTYSIFSTFFPGFSTSLTMAATSLALITTSSIAFLKSDDKSINDFEDDAKIRLPKRLRRLNF